MKVITLDGYVGWEITGWELEQQLPEDKDEPVHIILNSTGGVAWEGVYIYQLLRDRKNVTVETAAVVASAATHILMGASPEGRLVRPETTFMIHNSQFNWFSGDKNDFAKALERLTGLDNVIASIYARRTGKNKEELIQMMNDETWIYEGKNIVESGFADRVKEMDEESSEEDDSALNLELAKNLVMNDRDKYSRIPMSENSVMGQKAPMDRIFNLIEKGKVRMGEETKQGQAPGVMQNTVLSNPGTGSAPAAPEAATNTAAMNEAMLAEIKNSTCEAERARIHKILNAAGCQISESAMEAIKSGQSAGEYALNRLTEMNKIQSHKDNDEEAVTSIPSTPQVNDVAKKSNVSGARGEQIRNEVEAGFAEYMKQRNDPQRVG